MHNFPRTKRLLTKNHYDKVFNNHKKLVMPEFLLLVKPNDCGAARLGLAFSKKYLRNATLRNRIKRVFRESFRLNDIAAIDIIACARTSLANATNEKLYAELNKAWKQLAIMYAK